MVPGGFGVDGAAARTGPGLCTVERKSRGVTERATSVQSSKSATIGLRCGTCGTFLAMKSIFQPEAMHGFPRQQCIEPAACLHLARQLRCGFTGSKEDIAAYQALDRGAGVLSD